MKLPLILFALLHSIVPVLIEISKDLSDVGAIKLVSYTWADWLILGVGCAALMGSNLLSFFSTKWADYKSERKVTGNTETITKL